MLQANTDSNANVVRLPLTEAERSQRYRARKALKKLARKSKPRGGKKPVTKAVTVPVTKAASRDGSQSVDLVQLRRDIWRWVADHQEANNRPAVERHQRRKDRVAQFSLLTVAVAFYVFLAVAAGTHP